MRDPGFGRVMIHTARPRRRGNEDKGRRRNDRPPP